MLACGGRDDGLFRAAIAQSGSPVLMWSSVSATDWQPLYEAFMNATNCTNAVSWSPLDCLRRAPAANLSDVFSSNLTTLNRPNPVVDGNFLQKLESSAIEAGDFVKVPLLLRTRQEEGAWSYYSVEGINTTAEFRAMVEYDGLSTAAANKWAERGVDVYTYVYDVLFHAKWWQHGAQEQGGVAFLFHNVTLSESLSPTDQADQKKTFEPLNVTELCRVEPDTYRSAAISHWMELFQTCEYPK
ncbi:hypothetical protein ASPACDRAFT_56976 [Aspergillus aculeatus ATCC 16872]|uniref:Carboxylesterase type B domain-containing protein n=1 Tax=Aspergillus aculeatus (strain ATCC 16872 / CBS 172.66 / WB 5094) TaxID=690307 RepID=A0A1L9X560_ASPA1|nr:uncharacterized protein ASPACDRAFT_56976 [Aspergillus aculeatus ATCC 16872]OJK03585.1 hypothetical protein ASPACDRAFT_56976 [Aspergillus aculeatus ATCC 16872]